MLIGYLVNFMLVWRVLAARALTERLGEAFIPGVLIVLSCISMWMLLTVFAVALAQQPKVRRTLQKEIADYQANAEARALRRRTGGCEDGSHGFREPVDLNLIHRQDVLIGRRGYGRGVGCRSIPTRSGRPAGVLR